MRTPALLPLLLLPVLLACEPPLDAGSIPMQQSAPPPPPGIATLRLQPQDLPPGQTVLRLGVTPYSSPAALTAELQPIAGWLTGVLGVQVQLSLASSYEELVAQFAAGNVDVALFSPLSYVLARRRVPELHLMAQTLSYGATSYTSYILVRVEDSAQSLADLKGRRIAWVDPFSTAGYLFPYDALLAAGVDPEKDLRSAQFAGTHEAALAALTSGQVDAAAVSSSTLVLKRGDPAHGFDLGSVRILARAGRIPYDATCARPAIAASGVRKIGWALQNLDTRSQQGRTVLATAEGITGWIPAADSAYDGVRAVLGRVQAHRDQAGRPEVGRVSH